MDTRFELRLHERSEQRPIGQTTSVFAPPMSGLGAVDSGFGEDKLGRHDFVEIYPDADPKASARYIEELRAAAGPDVEISTDQSFVGNPAPSGMAGAYFQDLILTFGSVASLTAVLKASKDVLIEWLRNRPARKIVISQGADTIEVSGPNAVRDLESAVALADRKAAATRQGDSR
ncbi:hypothetical protein [Geodermatophilus sp. URMC 64]